MKKPVFEQAKEKYDNLIRQTKNKIRQKQREFQRELESDQEVIKLINDIAEYSRKAEEKKQAFVEECAPIIPKIFFFDDKYKQEKGLDNIDKNDVDREFLAAYLENFSPTYSELDFAQCVKFLKDPMLRNGVITRANGQRYEITNEVISGLITINKVNYDIIEKDRNSTLKRKKFLGFIKPLARKYDEELAQAQQELDQTTEMINLLCDVFRDIARAKATCETMGTLLDNKTYMDAKTFDGLVQVFERSLEGLRERRKYEPRKNGISFADEVEQIRAKGKAAALRNFSKESLAELAQSGEDYFELGIAAAGQSNEISNYLRSEFIK